MSEILHPDGSIVSIGNVDVSAVGLGGIVDVLYPGNPETRSIEDATAMLLNGFKEANITEQLTVAISDSQEYPVDLRGMQQRRSGGPTEQGITVSLPDPGSDFGQIILSCDEDGVLRWHIANEIASNDKSRGGGRRTYTIPARVPKESAEGSRGLIAAVGKKLLKVLIFELMDKTCGAIGDYFVSRYEQRHAPHRLRSFTANNYRSREVDDLLPEDLLPLTEGRALLFIHGTASRAHKAFAMLPDGFVRKLISQYDGRVFAFDHPTLSVTPTDNVNWLAGQINTLPGGKTLDIDIIAHSRGGLVGRLMCERPAGTNFNLGRLNVHNLTMVATPNAGTPLADCKHLDTFLNTMTNLLEFIPSNPATDTLNVILALVKQAAVGAMGGLDGLTAMDPQGSFLRTQLNRPSQVSTVYHAIGADFEPAPNSPLGRFARDYLTDLVFLGQPNDLVVPTDGVFAQNGATPFPIQDHLSLGASEAVDHSGYWTNDAVLDVLNHCP
jgi:hypothetical protein